LIAHAALTLQSHSSIASARPARKSISVGFFLLPQFSLVSLSGALDVLARANEAAGEKLYELSLFSVDGAPVASGSGAEVVVQGGLSMPDGVLHSNPFVHLDAVFVLSDAPLPQHGHQQLITALQAFAVSQKIMGGFGTGAYLLARANALTAYRATIHWPYVSLFAEDFPDTVVSTNLFEMDRGRLTCASGNASFDMMLAWIAQRLPDQAGEEIVADLIDHFGHERQRSAKEHQRVPLAARIGGGQPKLTEAVSLMEANFEEPLPTEEIARLVGVSRRQLERLFKQYLNSLPSRYYLELRLTRARQLLQQTSQSILQIGLSCGFSSGPHFSSAYRNHFGITPREQRTQRLSAANNVMTAVATSFSAAPGTAANSVAIAPKPKPRL